MKKIVILVASVVAISSIISMTACDQVNKIPGAENVTSMAQGLGETAKSWGMTAKDWADAGINNIKESAMKQINSEVDKFMEENNIPKDKADEVMKNLELVDEVNSCSLKKRKSYNVSNRMILNAYKI